MKKLFLTFFTALMIILNINAQTGSSCNNPYLLSLNSEGEFTGSILISSSPFWISFIPESDSYNIDIFNGPNVQSLDLISGSCSQQTVIVSKTDSLSINYRSFISGNQYYLKIISSNINTNINLNLFKSIDDVNPPPPVSNCNNTCPYSSGNLVGQNWNFSTGTTTGFQSTYAYETPSGLLSTGAITIVNNSNAAVTSWNNTTTGAPFLCVNGSSPLSYFLRKTITGLTINRRYYLLVKVRNPNTEASTTYSIPEFKARINGIDVIPGTLIPRNNSVNVWYQLCGTWIATSSTANIDLWIWPPISGSGDDLLVDEIEFYQLNSPLITASASPSTVCLGASVNLTSTYGPSYVYQWTGPGGFQANSQNTTVTPTSSGAYTVVATYPAGCTGSSTVNVTVNPIPVVTTNAFSNICSGSTSNIILYSNVPGTTFSWTATYNSVTGGAASGISNPITQTLNTTGSSPGTATFIITPTANGCTGLPVTVTINVTPNPMSSIVTSPTSVQCYGQCNGQATVNTPIIGGTPPYTYLWSNSQTTNPAVNLCAGTYFVTVRDDVGCTKSSFVTITQPTNIGYTITKTQPGCNGVCNGQITLNPTGGTPPYTYLWNTTPPQTTATATNLCAGSYGFTITDQNNCTVSSLTNLTNSSTSGWPWEMVNTTGYQEICDMVYDNNYIYAIGMANGDFTLGTTTYNLGTSFSPYWNWYRWIYVVKLDYCGHAIDGKIYGYLYDPIYANNSPVKTGRFQIDKLVDGSGNLTKIVVAGIYDYSMNFTNGLPALPNTNYSDIFLAYLDPGNLYCSNGSDQISFSSGNSLDYALGLSTEGQTAFITGDFMGTSINFLNPVTATNTTLTNASAYADLFIAKYDWNTTLSKPELKWAFNNYNGAPNTLNDWGFNMKFINDINGGKLYFTSMTANSTYGNVSFLWWVNATTGAYQNYSRLGTGTQYFGVTDMATYSGKLFLSGYYQSVYNQNSTANKQAFVYVYPSPSTAITWNTSNLKLSPQADPANWATKLAVNTTTGDVFVSGTFASSAFYFDIPFQISLAIGTTQNQFITKFNSNLSGIWNKGIFSGISGSFSSANAVVFDNTHNMFYIGGAFNGTINLENGSQQMVSTTGTTDAFVARFRDNGTNATYLRPVNPQLINDSISVVNNDLVKVNPNPSNGTFEITTESNATIDNIIVSDITGRIVYNDRPVSSSIKIDLSDLSIGTYYSIFTSNNKVSYKKLVIIK
ncbi:MAG: T9SS type A sorting domain-containing protein [Bacteroidia bacterium]|nr:T9SS type A sorting domain-containing protein [Bacteroidia bacterium]